MFQANAVGDLVELVGFTRYLGFACVGLVLRLVATTTVMGVQDRIKEHAVLQTIGFTGWQIFGLVLAESLLVGLCGGLLGTLAGTLVLASGSLAVGTEGVIIAFEPSIELALSAMGLSVLVGLLAGVVPAWHAGRAEIVPALRFV